MSELSLLVGGRTYAVSCADGEEDHIRHLASLIEDKMTGLGNAFPAGDPRRMLFAALLLADEAEDGRRKLGEVTQTPHTGDDAAADALEAIATRLETLATELENSARAPR